MGKNQVHPAPVDIKGLSQILAAHRGAFDVPAWPAVSPGALPERLAWLALLPQREVHRMALAFFDFNAGARLQLIELFPRKLAVIREALDLIKNVAVDLISGAPLLEPPDQGDHFRNMVRRFRFYGRHQKSQGASIPVESLNVATRQLVRRYLELRGTLDDLVIHVGKVTDKFYFVPQKVQIADDHIEGDQRTRVTHMAVVVNGDAAHVDPYFSLFERDKSIFGA